MELGPHTRSNDVPVVRDVAPHLFLVVNGDRPQGSPLRVALRHLSRVDLRRAPHDSAPGLVVDGGTCAVLVPDAWMSTVHATLERVMGSWSIEDRLSRNGTFVNGRRVRRASLRDGDLIEAGHTFFIFREALRVSPDPGGKAGVALAAIPAFATVLPHLGASFEQLESVAHTAIPVLILGETGTGKDLVASSLHALSGREGPFQIVNCAALAAPDVQSRLFGEADAAGGAVGLVRAADRGTLYFDELFDLPAGAQSLLLRTLQDGEVFPVGAARPLRVDVRVAAATNHTLEDLSVGNRVRADLLARLSGFTVRLPPLRDRREDLGLLIRHLVGGEGASFSVEAMRAMLLHRWPLNVRELEQTVRAAVVLSRGRPIGLADLPAPMHAAGEAEAVPVEPAHDGTAPARPATPAWQRFVDEVSRRHVVRVMVAYAVAVFGALQGFDIIVTRLSLPPRWMVWLVIASLVGLPVTAVLSWVYDWTRAGIVRTAPLAPDHVAPPSERRVQRRMLVLAVLLLAMLATGGMLWWRARSLGPGSP